MVRIPPQTCLLPFGDFLSSMCVQLQWRTGGTALVLMTQWKYEWPSSTKSKTLLAACRPTFIAFNLCTTLCLWDGKPKISQDISQMMNRKMQCFSGNPGTHARATPRLHRCSGRTCRRLYLAVFLSFECRRSGVRSTLFVILSSAGLFQGSLEEWVIQVTPTAQDLCYLQNQHCPLGRTDQISDSVKLVICLILSTAPVVAISEYFSHMAMPPIHDVVMKTFTGRVDTAREFSINKHGAHVTCKPFYYLCAMNQERIMMPGMSQTLLTCVTHWLLLL